MPCRAMHPIQDLFLESFSYELQFDMQFLYALLFAQNFYSCKKWVLHNGLLLGPSESMRDCTSATNPRQYQERRRRMPCCLPSLVKMLKALPVTSPSLRMSLWQSVGPRKCLRWSAEHNSRCSPFCKPGVSSYVMPSSVPHR
jgi:hypothetical protein